jgi:catechol 2,3-dioxygenase-like lactoylglutathione lyase family enzyme
MRAHFILYVDDQTRSTAFFRAVLGKAPSLDVPGMTEFELGVEAVLGLMPRAGIELLLGVSPGVESGGREVRAELYFVVDDPAAYHARALSHGGLELSGLARRDWGHDVAYSVDPDGYVLAFARVPEADATDARS